MLHKAMGAVVVLLLMTELASAQQPTGITPGRPGLQFKDDKPSASKEQKEYDKALDRVYRSTIKDIPEQKKSDPWGDIRPAPSGAAKNKPQ